MEGGSIPGGNHLTGAGAELALNVLTGRERAQAIEHLQRCGTCRIQLSAMAVTGDELLRLLPHRQPPPGFTNQVAGRLRRVRNASPRRRPHAMLAAAAALVMVAAGGLSGWQLHATADRLLHTGATTPTALRSAALITPGHQAAGKVFLHRGSGTWMFVTADLPAGDGTVVCQLTDQAGHTITVGSFRVIDGDGYWGSPEPDQPAAITGARLVNTAGTVLATASFGRDR